MLASTVSLGALRLQAYQRADLENSEAISIPEMNQYISQSYKRLVDMLIAAYGNEYSIAPLFQFVVSAGQYYPLPDGKLISLGQSLPAPALYKLIGVDLMNSQGPTGFVTLRRFEEIERNKFAWPNTSTTFLGFTNLRYRLSGTNIEFIPIPCGGQTIQIKYIPKPTSLQFLETCGTTLNSAVITMSDTSDLQIGMSAYGPGVQTTTTPTIISINPNVSVTISSPVLQTAPVVTIAFWIDSVVIDGIAGWEEYVIIDAAIKCKIKQEQDVSDLRVQKAEMVADIQGMAEARDLGQAFHTSDVLGCNGGGGYDGDGFSGGGGCGY